MIQMVGNRINCNVRSYKIILEAKPSVKMLKCMVQDRQCYV